MRLITSAPFVISATVLVNEPCTVVNLETVREARRMATYRVHAERILEANRLEFSRLHDSGALFSTRGAKVGRQLLLARQNVLKIIALLEELSGEGALPAPRSEERIEAVYSELDALLDRTAALTQKTQPLLERL